MGGNGSGGAANAPNDPGASPPVTGRSGAEV